MKELSISEVYEKELEFMPYKKSLQKVEEIVCSRTPRNGKLLDVMCGPGYLLGRVNERRRDISLRGMDLDHRYIEHSSSRYPDIAFEVGNVLTWRTKELYDVVICTGALHHVPYDDQSFVVEKMASWIKPGGFAIISDCHIDDYQSEQRRKAAAAKLGYEYLVETIQNGAPSEVIAATADILQNDVMMHEFKTSLAKRLPIVKKHFKHVDVIKTWPAIETQYGDYIMVSRNF